MEETQKPFACSEIGCGMTFTNEDHLNWHQKKHDMMLNLGLGKNNDVADQTPTPTRFIRTCEEVGLFQDLQNVNPFDEFFKKAVETTKAGRTLEVPETNSDDTLHTPHILPHIEENQKKISSTTNQDDNNSQFNDFSLNNVIPITTTTDSDSENDKIAECDSTSVIVIDDDSTDEYNVKMKIRDALQSKEKQKNEKENFTNSAGANLITVVPFQNLAVVREVPKNTTDNEKVVETREKVVETREKVREMNRAAQVRCRKRKQRRWKEMEGEISSLKQENKRLKTENYNLRFKLTTVLEQSFNETVQDSISEAPIQVAQNQKTSKKETVQGPKSSTLVPIAPNPRKEIVQGLTGTLIPIVQYQKTSEKGPCSVPLNTATAPPTSVITLKSNNTPGIPHPVVIQIFPNGSNATVSVVKKPSA